MIIVPLCPEAIPMSAQTAGAIKASDIMSPDVISVTPETLVAEATQLMLDRGVSGLPVTTADGLLQGMLTEGDLLRRTEIGTQRPRRRWLSLLHDPAVLANEYAHANGKKVGDVMTQFVVTVIEETPIEEIIQTMEDYGVKRLLVVRGRRVMGIISRADIVRAVNAKASAEKHNNASDKAIRRALGRELHNFVWRQSRPRFDVSNGIVDYFWAGPASDWERKAARVAADTVPGIKEVREHFFEK